MFKHLETASLVRASPPQLPVVRSITPRGSAGSFANDDMILRFRVSGDITACCLRGVWVFRTGSLRTLQASVFRPKGVWLGRLRALRHTGSDNAAPTERLAVLSGLQGLGVGSGRESEARRVESGRDSGPFVLQRGPLGTNTGGDLLSSATCLGPEQEEPAREGPRV